MNPRSALWLVVLGLVSATLLSPSSLPARAQEATAVSSWTLSKNAFGQPDFEGVWANNTATPFERPAAFEGKESLSEEELAELNEKLVDLRENAQAGDLLGDFLIQKVLEDPEFRGFDQQTGNYNSFWLVERELDERTSLIVDPPDGRLPPYTAEARQRLATRVWGITNPDGPEALSNNVRCISYGVPNTLAGYNSYFKFVQTQDYVMILQELIHHARIIPLDGRPALSEDMRFWNGDSRGRWDGDSLLVETANYTAAGSYRGASENLRVVERFTRVGPEVLEWRITFRDPSTWERDWTMMIPLKRSEDKIYEYACHEGNHSMRGILAGARLEEQTAAGESEEDR